MPAPEVVPRAHGTALREVEVWTHAPGLAAGTPNDRVVSDLVAVEAPVEVRLDGRPFAVSMRTPGNDQDLALGFLLTEGVIVDPAEVLGVSLDADGDWVDVQVAPGRADEVRSRVGTRRRVTTTSACGLCGRASLDSLRVGLPRVTASWQISHEVVAALPRTLASAQAAFRSTGGMHAAAIVDRDGVLLASAEDVGRHNAVDKLLGRFWRAGQLPLSDAVLMVSGRTSFEIVQKAWYGGLPLVAAVSAPSSLAIDLANEAGITLLGFVREQRFNVYAHPERIDGAP